MAILKEDAAAVWQYLVEHSKSTPEGYWHINFIAQSKSKFFEKVAARRKGYRKFQENENQ